MNLLLTALVVVAIAIILIQISRITEMVSTLKGEEKTNRENTNIFAYMMLGFLVVSFIYFGWAHESFKKYVLPPASSEHGHHIDSMFNWTLFWTGIIFVLTQVLLFWFVFKYRYNKNRKAFYFPDHHKLELWWTIIPAIVLIILTIQGVNRWVKVMGNPDKAEIVFEATGMQFNWMLRYPGADGMLGNKNYKLIDATNQLGQDWEDKRNLDDVMVNEIHLPVGKTVLVKITARDVLHSFFLPHFRVKMDAVPGIPTQFVFTPIKTTNEMRKEFNNPDFNYELACAEICGKGHFSMRKVVVVDSEEDYKKWLSEQKSYYETVVKPSMEQKKMAEKNENKPVAAL